jgi:deoxycytidylate deaminase
MQDRHMRTAFLWAERGTCIRTNSAGQRMQVGAVITSEDMTDIYGIGYNGNAHGLPNKCDTDVPGACGCIHAEENAVIKCGRRPEPKYVFTTHLPCVACAKRIINLKGVVKVFWAIPYRIETSLEILKQVGIANERLVL